MLSQSTLSPAERRFLEDGVRQGFRNDGRGLLDYRPYTVETGILPSTSGGM